MASSTPVVRLEEGIALLITSVPLSQTIAIPPFSETVIHRGRAADIVNESTLDMVIPASDDDPEATCSYAIKAV